LLSVGLSTGSTKKLHASHGQIHENGIIPIIDAASLSLAPKIIEPVGRQGRIDRCARNRARSQALFFMQLAEAEKRPPSESVPTLSARTGAAGYIRN
jgi:hypothetical protein